MHLRPTSKLGYLSFNNHYVCMPVYVSNIKSVKNGKFRMKCVVKYDMSAKGAS